MPYASNQNLPARPLELNHTARVPLPKRPQEEYDNRGNGQHEHTGGEEAISCSTGKVRNDESAANHDDCIKGPPQDCIHAPISERAIVQGNTSINRIRERPERLCRQYSFSWQAVNWLRFNGRSQLYGRLTVNYQEGGFSVATDVEHAHSGTGTKPLAHAIHACR